MGRAPKGPRLATKLRNLLETDINRDPAARYLAVEGRLTHLPSLKATKTDPAGEGYASGYGRRRKKVFYDVPEETQGLAITAGSRLVRETTKSDYEKLPGAPSFGTVEFYAKPEERPRNGPTTPLKQQTFEPDLPAYSPRYVPKDSPVSDDESLARQAFPFAPPVTRKDHTKKRPSSWGGVRTRVFGDMAAREILMGAYRAEDARAETAPSKWAVAKKRVHGDMAARELLMGGYRQADDREHENDEITDWRDPDGNEFRSVTRIVDDGSPKAQDRAASKVQARIRGRNARREANQLDDSGSYFSQEESVNTILSEDRELFPLGSARHAPRGHRFLLRVRVASDREEKRRVVGRDDLRTLRHASKCALATLGLENELRKRPGFGVCYKDPITRRTISLLTDADWLVAREAGLRQRQPQVFLLVDVPSARAPLRPRRTARVEFNRVPAGPKPSFQALSTRLLPHRAVDARLPPYLSPKKRTPLKERRRRLALNLEKGLVRAA